MKFLGVVFWLWNCVLIEAKFSDRFPDGFLMGFATASYQVEGAWNEDGKGENIWDRLVHTQPERVADRTTGDIACNSYHKFREDVQILNGIGADVYRFSISWSRILPKGDISVVNPAGVDYYKKLISELLLYKIEPMVTLYHWDLPQPLQDLGGWTNPLMVDYFEDYARFVFQTFGDKVKWWITFNEPYEQCYEGYGSRGLAPALNQSGIADYLCGHILLMSHARAYHIYNNEFRETQKGKIGISLSGGWNEPLTDSVEDKIAAEESLQFQLGWFLHPIIEGDYPTVMRTRVDANSKSENRRRSRLPYFSEKWKAYIKGTIDYLGVNHYTTYQISTAKTDLPIPSYERDMNISHSQNSSWPGSAIGWLKVEPKGFRKKLNWLKNYTNNFPMFITENGYASTDDLNDPNRIQYYRLYLKELLKAIYEDKCNVIGYLAWSIIDNFEWLAGYTARFGIYQVDFDNPKRPRTPRDSAAFFKKLLHERVLPSNKINFREINNFEQSNKFSDDIY